MTRASMEGWQSTVLRLDGWVTSHMKCWIRVGRMYHSSESQTSNLPGIVSGQGLAGGQRRDDTPGASWICGPAPSAVGATGSTGPVYGATGFNATTPDSKLAKVKTPSATLEARERALMAERSIAPESISYKLDRLLTVLERIDINISSMANQQRKQDWYTTAETADLLGVAEDTVRDWCRFGRIHAEKKGSGRGPNKGWAISHDEIERYRKSGLLPLQRVSR